jgi:hypothetical protein
MADQRRPPISSTSLRITSLNPVRDAKSVGFDVGMSQKVADAKRTALSHRYRKLMADGTGAEADDDREARLENLLVHVGWSCDMIADDLTSLGAMHEDVERRDQLVRDATGELIGMAELSSPNAPPATWREALVELRAAAEALIRSDERTAAQLADLDLIIERITHAEHVASEALHSYLGFISA